VCAVVGTKSAPRRYTSSLSLNGTRRSVCRHLDLFADENRFSTAAGGCRATRSVGTARRGTGPIDRCRTGGANRPAPRPTASPSTYVPSRRDVKQTTMATNDNRIDSRARRAHLAESYSLNLTYVIRTTSEFRCPTRSSAVAERPRDASCLSIVSFNIPTAQFFITSYCGFRFTIA